VNSYAASQHKIRDEGDRVITLRNVIETEKSTNDETDRHMHLSWDNFRRLKSEYESLFDELICTDPDRLRGMHEELGRLSKEVELGWKLKQDQLEDLLDILHHENYTTTGLFSGNDGVDQLCKGLSEYVETVNGTAWEVEKPELDEHLQEVQDIKIAIDTHPCPCVWSSWEMWSECSTTCEAGSRYRQREIEKEAINNGADCLGEDEEREACNADVCCPVNCIWSLWGEWNACPSGCDQHTTRTRTKAVVAECEGIDCAGMDYEEKSCSRERELEDKITELKQKIGQCQVNLGCYEDKPGRQLSGKWELNLANNSPIACDTYCQGFKYYGLQYWTQCFCGDTLNHSVKKPDSECNAECPGDSSKKCGGTWRQNIYETSTTG